MKIIRCGLFGSVAIVAVSMMALPVSAAEIFHTQGEVAGEPGIDSVILQSRLTATAGLAEDRSVPGTPGVGRFHVDEGGNGVGAIVTPWLRANPDNDYIIRHLLTGLKRDTRYGYRLEFGENESSTQKGPQRWFRTLPGAPSASRLSFLFFNCMGWGQYMDGYGDRRGYDGPDKSLGYPTLVKMQAYADSHFVIGGGDLVYYDMPAGAVARTLPQLRAKWQQQFSQPRLVQLVGSMGSFWMKDDHDFRYDDGDLTGTREPSPALGIHTFKEQMPVVPPSDFERPTYRTFRATKHAQLWLLEGRDYRSPNRMEDGPDKTIWGSVQKEWLKRTLVDSDAAWKLIITPTPMVGPDSARKRDNHTNPQGFRHEGESFFAWMKDQRLKNVVLFTGDRHWQYHSIHPSGFSEFACGSLHREVAVGNPPLPGAEESSDPQKRVTQPYVTTEQDGGFLRVVVEADARLQVEVINQSGVVKYVFESRP
jgi:alkaline phosphatase D